MAYDAVVIGAGHNGLAAAVHLGGEGSSGRGRRGQDGARRRRQDARTDSPRLPARPLRHEPVDVRRLALLPGAQGCAARARTCLRAGRGLLRDGVSRWDLSRRQPHARQDARGHVGPLVRGRARRGGICSPGSASTRRTSSRCSVRRCPRWQPPRSSGRHGAPRERAGSSTRAAAAGDTARLSRRALRTSQGQDDDGRLGTASRFRARCRGRRAVPLSRDAWSTRASAW